MARPHRSPWRTALGGRKVQRLLISFALGAVLLLLTAPVVGAHALVRSSDPADGAQLDHAPDAVTITFTEPPEVSLSSVDVLDATGETWHEDAAFGVEGDPLKLSVGLRQLPVGVYTVTWRTVSKADGHATAGAFTFGVGTNPAAAPPPPVELPSNPPTSPLEVTGRFGLIAGLVFVLGSAWIAALMFADWPRAVRWLTYGALAVAAVGLVVLGVAQLQAADSGVRLFFSTRVGGALQWRAGALLTAALALLAAQRGRREARVVFLWVVAAAAAAGMLAHVAAGHAAAGESWRWAMVGFQWAHFAGVGVWIGGLAALLLGTRGAPRPDKGRAVRRFSTVAGVMLAVVVGTGVVRAVNEIDGWGNLVTTGYGRVVLIKAGLLLGLAGLGAVNRYRNVPAASTNLSGLRKASRVELGFAGVALLTAGLLASLSPPTPDAADVGSPVALVVSGADFATSVRVLLEATPGFAGSNSFSVSVEDFDTGEPIQAQRVSLRFAFLDRAGIGESTLRLEPRGEGGYQATGSNLSLDGHWRVTTVIERGIESVEVPLEVATRCRSQEVTQPGRVAIHEMELSDGATVQSYLDPAEPGRNDIHLTFLAADGSEMHIEEHPTVRVIPEDGKAVDVDVQRFSHGHFVASGDLPQGPNRIEVEASDTERGMLEGCFEEQISP